MQIALSNRASKIAVLGTVFLITILYLASVSAEFLASRLAERPQLSSLQHAVKLQPGNADYRDRVGRYFFLVERSPAAAIEAYQAAVALNPHAARYWFDLAAAYQALGDSGEQGNALERAIVVDPKHPDAAWEAANLYLVQGETEKALREFGIVLQSNPSLSTAALELCRHVADVSTILKDIMPDAPQPYYALLDILMKNNEREDAAKVWAQLVSLHQPIAKVDIFEYIRFLLAEKDVDQARTVWGQATTLNGQSAYQPSAENLIVNGDFSLDVLNGGFDWTYQKSPEVSLALDPTESHTGHRSLRIIFDARAIEDAGIRQLVPVEPKTAYEFSAHFKATDIQGAGGPRFVLQDVYSNKMYFASDDLKDADFWSPVSGTFTTDENTKLLVLRIQRAPPGIPIKGKLWIDGVRLQEKQEQ